MNLHGIAKGLVSAVNPMTRLSMQRSLGGYTTAADGTRTTNYSPPFDVFGQVQDLTSDELKQLDGINLQGVHRSIYLNGHWEGLERTAVRGGTLLTTPDGNVWLVVKVIEQWPDWCKVAVTLQNGS